MWKDLKTPFFTVLFIFIGFFVFTKIFGPIPFTVNSITTTKQTLFTATGTGEVAAVADTAKASLGVNKNAPTVEAAKDQVNNIINQITKDLKALGIDEKDIKTINFSVNPSYDYTTGSQTPKGYTADATLEVVAQSIDTANKAIDIATRDGATQIGGVQFVLNDDKQKELEDQARRIAIKNAKQKAQSIANAAGIKLGRIVDVQESSGGQPIPYAMKAEDRQTASGEPTTELNPGENKVTVNVSLSYETY